MELEQMIKALSSFVDYLENFIDKSKEPDIAITKLKETVFWITYLSDKEVLKCQ